jgi:hypothetical protein
MEVDIVGQVVDQEENQCGEACPTISTSIGATSRGTPRGLSETSAKYQTEKSEPFGKRKEYLDPEYV